MSDFMTFLGGAAVGTLVTYLAKNEEARKAVDGFVDGVGKRFTDVLRRVTPKTEEVAEEAEAEPVAETQAKPRPAKRVTRPRRVAKAKKEVAEGTPVH
jgi:hypothetical protein